MRNASRLLAPVALFLCVPFAAALDEMSASAEGRGSIAILGQNLGVNRAEVSLIPGGKFIISLTGDERYMFRGDWQEQGNRIALTVKEAQGSASEGSGELRLRGDRFRTITLSGANRAFSADFTVTGAYKDFTAGGTTSEVIRAPTAPQITAPQTPPTGQITAPVAPKNPESSLDPPKITVQGSGTLSQAREGRKAVDAMEIFLERDGRVHLKTFGQAGEVVLEGTWRDGGKAGDNQRFDLAIVSGFGAQASGQGFVLVGADGRIARVSVQGAVRGQRGGYSLDFRPR
jgi:hypothetical protein